MVNYSHTMYLILIECALEKGKFRQKIIIKFKIDRERDIIHFKIQEFIVRLDFNDKK